MQIVYSLLSHLEALAWPLVALTAIVLYREVLSRLVPGSRIKLTILGVTVETTLPVLEQSVTESLGGRKITANQLAILKKLKAEGRTKFDRDSLSAARPLRNAGLIRFYPEDGFLESADEIEITTLGRLLIEAAEEQSA
jgi:hypothetical protein